MVHLAPWKNIRYVYIQFIEEKCLLSEYYICMENLYNVKFWKNI